MPPTCQRILLLHMDGSVIRTKPDHPFFTENGWVNAGDLRAGDLLRTHDGSWATVLAVAIEEQPVHQFVPGFLPYPATGLLTAGR